ncbi:MAG: phosphate ABC transporter substrate-binding protein [Oscillatoriales cyanobacterium CG2_30_44_21]|nr:MAG: phosphate ABC transporter substrate-binding protein [Oscillatoriales cyanobacterium CG2_30_44_21]
MAQNKETTVLALSLLISAGLAGGGYWLFAKSKTPDPVSTSPTPASTASSSPVASLPSSLPPNNSSHLSPSAIVPDLEVSLPNPPVITMDGSVTMVKLMKQLQAGYSQKNPSTPSTYGIPDGRPNGSNKGITALLNNQVLIAANSRSLNAEEVTKGLRAVPIARDALAIVIGINNSFTDELTMAQLKDIYQGKITNWSQLGGADQPIKVINRAKASGTQSLFHSIVLSDEPFAPDSNNFITWPRDETTAILQALGDNGISYTTVSQAVGQEIIKIVPINGALPTDVEMIKSGKYPISRVISLAVQRKISPVIKEFIDFTLSPRGQEIVTTAGFVPL